MTTSDALAPMTVPTTAYVWTWLPDRTDPVVAGRIDRDRGAARERYTFVYGKSYLARPDAVPLYDPELPLRAGLQVPDPPLTIASCLRDAAPDAWGRRVLINRLISKNRERQGQGDDADLDELTCMLRSGSDRVGALDFQASPRVYEPRLGEAASLDDLLTAAERVEAGRPIEPVLDRVLYRGSSIGGARPKAEIEDASRKFIAKFASSSDAYDVVGAEYVAMRLAREAGLDVASVRLERTAGKRVLLVERFDRVQDIKGWRRRGLVSALTMLGLDEMQARYASYPDLAEMVRKRFVRPEETLRELFGRMVLNVLVGNTDDHARNHAAFWNGVELELTPAYDLCPQMRSGREANQAMLVTQGDRRSRLATCFEAAPFFQLTTAAALATAERIASVVKGRYETVCDEAGVTEVDRRDWWGRRFFNPYAFEELPKEVRERLG